MLYMTDVSYGYINSQIQNYKGNKYSYSCIRLSSYWS